MTALRATALTPTQFEKLIELYEHLHRTPELAFAETGTAKIMADQLRRFGGTVHENIGGTGVVGVFENGEGPTIVLRADMDALPIAEETGLHYASTATATDAEGMTVPVMHACGHDIHMVSLLGAVEVLTTNLGEWRGTLVALFQPAEEIARGAQAMIDDNVFDLFARPTVILGQHVGNRAAGTLSYTEGPAMASADSLRVTITGRGAHGSRPEASIDPVVIAASIVVRLQSIVSREIAPSDIAVVTVGSLHAGAKENIIPSSAELKISVRALKPNVRAHLLAAITRIVNAECAAAGVETPPLIEKIGSFPRLDNAAPALRRTVAALREGLGADRVTEVLPITISEDFGILGTHARVESFFWFIGSTEPGRFSEAVENDQVDRTIPANHSAGFAPIPIPTIGFGIDALLVAFAAWAEH